MGKKKSNTIITSRQPTGNSLTDSIQEQRKGIIKYLYLRTQVNAILGHHHTELLKELLPVLTPMTEAVTNLQGELSHCKNSLGMLSAEITN